jgi:hypothetical protein
VAWRLVNPEGQMSHEKAAIFPLNPTYLLYMEKTAENELDDS